MRKNYKNKASSKAASNKQKPEKSSSKKSSSKKSSSDKPKSYKPKSDKSHANKSHANKHGSENHKPYKPQNGQLLPTIEMRLAKYIARAGVCSRRAAEKLIENGHVHVNKKVIKNVATNVLSSDIISVNGRRAEISHEPVLYIFHKPKGYLCTNSDPKGRAIIFDILPDHLPRLISVGRLDMNSEGLILLSNDGEIARELELPSTSWTRRYRVRAYGKISEEKLMKLKDGVVIDGMRYGEIIAKIERQQGQNIWLNISLTEGKNREIKNVLLHFGLKVNRLIRVSYGPFQLGEMPKGEVKKIPAKVMNVQLAKILKRIEDKQEKNKHDKQK